jgi:hypothetical protein
VATRGTQADDTGKEFLKTGQQPFRPPAFGGSQAAAAFLFVTEAIENVPAGYRAHETYRFAAPDSFEETFELARPGKEFEVYVKTTFKKEK